MSVHVPNVFIHSDTCLHVTVIHTDAHMTEVCLQVVNMRLYMTSACTSTLQTLTFMNNDRITNHTTAMMPACAIQGIHCPKYFGLFQVTSSSETSALQREPGQMRVRLRS